MTASRQLPLAVAAHRLGMTYHQVRALVLRGDLTGGQDDQGRWYALGTAVARLQRRSDRPTATPASKQTQGARNGAS